MVNKIDLPKIILLWLVLGYVGDKTYRVQRDLNAQVQRKMSAKLGLDFTTETKPLENVADTVGNEKVKTKTEAKKVDDEEDKKPTMDEEAKKEKDAKPQEEKNQEKKEEEPKLITNTSEGEVAEKK